LCQKHGQKRGLSVVERSKIVTHYEERYTQIGEYLKDWGSARLQSINNTSLHFSAV